MNPDVFFIVRRGSPGPAVFGEPQVSSPPATAASAPGNGDRRFSPVELVAD